MKRQGCVKLMSIILGLVLLTPFAASAANTLTLPAVQLLPSQTGTFGISLSNTDQPSAVELTFTYDAAIGFDVTQIALATRAQGVFDLASDIKTLATPTATTKQVHVLLYKLTATPPVLPAGAGDIVTVTYQTTAAGTGATALAWNAAKTVLSDAAGQTLPVGTLTDGQAVFGYVLQITKAGSGTGVVTSSDAKINCGTTCAALYTPATPATVVTLTAAPASGSKFMGWLSGACSGTDPCPVTMDAGQNVIAMFATTYTITTTAGAGGTIFPAGPVEAIKDTDQTFIITANPDYRIVEVLIDGVAIPVTTEPVTYTFSKVTMPHAIAATFNAVPECADRMVCNGNFWQGPTLKYWEGVENAVLTTGRTGQGVQIAHDAANSDIYQTLRGLFDAGKTYQLTAWCLANPGAQCGLYLGDANTIADPTRYQNEARQFVNGTGTWQQLAVTLTLKNVERLDAYLYAPTLGSNVLYDDVEITEVCGSRTVCNGSFEQGLTNWGVTGNEAVGSGRIGSGVQVGHDNYNADVWQLLPGVFQPNTAYRVTAWCLAPLGAQCGLFFGDANDYFNPPAYQSEARSWVAGTGLWQPLSVTVTPWQDERMSIYLYAPTVGSTVAYDDVSITALPAMTCADRTACNGDFERGLDGWYSIENAMGVDGHSGLGVKVTADTQNGDVYQLLPGAFSQAKTYQVTTWCFAPVGASCQMYFGDANAFYGAPYQNEVRQVLPGTSTWQQMRVTLTLKNDERMNVYLYAPTTGSAVIYDDVQVTDLGLPACTDRMVCNGDFERGLEYWRGIQFAVNVAGRSGQGARVSPNGANNDISELIEGLFAGGKSYRVSAWCLAATGKRCGIYLGDDNALSNTPAYQNEVRGWIAGNGSWQYFSATLTLTQAERLSVYLYAPDDAVVYDDVQVAEVPTYQLTVVKTGSGTGTVTGSGVDCGTTCAAPYAEGTLLNLKATADAGSVFTGWLVNGQPATGIQTVTANVAVTAVFQKQ